MLAVLLDAKKTALPRVKLLLPATYIPSREAFAVASIKDYRMTACWCYNICDTVELQNV